MPNMSAKAEDLSDPAELILRIAYRNERMKTKLFEKEDPAAFVTLMAGHNKADLRRLAAVLGVPQAMKSVE